MSKLVVLFPGIGYHCDKPLLFYGRMLALEKGFNEVIKLTYTYGDKNIRGDEDKMKAAFEELYMQTKEQLKHIDFSAYDEVLFMSKSVGTITASRYAMEHNITNIKHILYTPLKYTFWFKPKNAIALIGDSDPWSNIDEICELAITNEVRLAVFPGLNHSLERADSVGAIENINILKEVMIKTGEFF